MSFSERFLYLLSVVDPYYPALLQINVIPLFCDNQGQAVEAIIPKEILELIHTLRRSALTNK
jgi:hypothetical protein